MGKSRMSPFSGRFIVFDGPDGSGKGTQIGMLEAALGKEGATVTRAIDPGGTAIGDRIRHVLLGYDLSEMDVRCETFLFMASRAQLVGEVIEPAIRRGDVVLCDRFISATCAYQGAAGYEIEQVIDLARYAIGETWPDLTLILDVPVEEGFKRTGRKPHHAGKRRKQRDADQLTLMNDTAPDAMEARPIDYHRKVRELFLELPGRYPRPVEVIDASGEPNRVHEQVMEAIRHAFA